MELSEYFAVYDWYHIFSVYLDFKLIETNLFQMAVVGGALLDKFIGTSEAEKAFQPWWDTVEDFLVYGLIMLGKIQI